MNTVQEKPPEADPLGSLLETDGEPNAKDETLAELERSLESLNDKLYEERFLWILAVVVLIDFYVFSHMENWSAPLVIGILQLVGVVILADRCKVNTVAPLVDKLTGFVHRTTRGGNQP